VLEIALEAQKPKPTKVAEKLAANEELLSQPNVVVQGRRMTSIDKEMEVGRWKIIQRELEQRGLPLPGEGRERREGGRAGM
jgi:hypothetical protein